MFRSFFGSPTPLEPPYGVAHVAYSLQTGGMERLLVEYARRADRDEFRLHFYSLTDAGTPAEDIAACGWPIACLGKLSGFRGSVVRRLAKAFQRDGIQIVHTHNSGAMIYGVLAARLAGAQAIIHTRHGQRFGASTRQTWTFAAFTRWIDRVVSVSQDGVQRCRREGVPANRVRLVHNGIDWTRFSRTGPLGDGPAILVARLVPEKDLPNLLAATAQVVSREPAFRLQIAGDGPCLPETRQMIAEQGLDQHVQLLGERRDVPELLQQASLFVLPSLTEGISLTLLEAMASGLPVVATRVGGNAEVVEHGRTGLLVPASDAGQLAEAILQIAGDRELAQRFGAAGRERVQQLFDATHMVRQYEAMYREVLSERAGKRRVEDGGSGGPSSAGLPDEPGS